jgi:hypothetical protein
VGAAALLAAGLNAVTYAAGGGTPLRLGHANKAQKSTSVTNKGKGPVLRLKAKKGPALAVNSTDLVKNLNAELVGGQSATQLAGVTTYALQAPGSTMPPGPTFRQFTLPAGTYDANANIGTTSSGNPGYSMLCVLSDAALLSPSPPPDIGTRIYLEIVLDSSVLSLQPASRVFTLATQTNLTFGCIVTNPNPQPILAVQPLTLAVRTVPNAPGTSAPFRVAARTADRAAQLVR